MSLSLYNTLTRQKEIFQPLTPGQVTIYCCGVTVYDYCHLGHARSYMVWDVLRRYLKWLGYHVRYVQNFTDIDDKILNRAKAEQSTMKAIAEKYTSAYFEDMARLNIVPADDYPRATHLLNGITRLIHQLEQRGYAYAVDGDVYYAVRQFTRYGKLSGRQLEQMQAGASGRVEADDPDAIKKKDPFDFALWKKAKPGEPSWESEWGSGRPGWHIECSAMVHHCLGDSIDIHCGGSDLIFPHHENEIAQSEAVSGKPLATYWLHNGFVNVRGEKMSKSLGNFTTIRQLLDHGQVHPMVLRLFVLQAHYRKPIDFTDDAIASAERSWRTLKEGLLFGYQFGLNHGDVPEIYGTSAMEDKPGQDSITAFQTAMDDDCNTPEALAVLFELAKELRRESNMCLHTGNTPFNLVALHHKWQTLGTLAGVLGLEVTREEEQNQGGSATVNQLRDDQIEALIHLRQTARVAKNWSESDRIRTHLQEHGITLIDQPGGITHWHRT